MNNDATSGSNERCSRELVDLRILDENLDGDTEAICLVAKDYSELLRPRVRSLFQAIGKGDQEQTRRLSHELKGTSFLLGCHPLAEELQEIEHAARKNGTDGLANRFWKVAPLVEQTIEEIETLVQCIDAPPSSPPGTSNKAPVRLTTTSVNYRE